MLGQVIASGAAMGAIYALVALGYVFVWNTMGIINFAAGEFITFAAYIFVATLITSLALPFPFALALIAILMAAMEPRSRASSSRACRGSEPLSPSSQPSDSASS
jgi:branched-chain amino acid transport system permease protein